jgi:flavodoxin
MSIGIIVYSQTGNTLAAARQLEHALAAKGHQAALEQIETTLPVKPGADPNVALKSAPDVEPYQALVLAAPVWGGIPAAPMVQYLEQLPLLEGKPIAILVTGFFPPAIGSKQAIARMTEMCAAKGGKMIGAGSVNRLTFGRKQKTAQLMQQLTDLF